MGAEACRICILGDRREVMEVWSTPYGFTFTVLLHIGLCMLCCSIFDLDEDTFTSGV